jgi:drug efflux transport system permease protein
VRRVLAVALKELRQASRDPLSLVMFLGLPTALLLLFGYALSFDVRHVDLAVEDRDRSAASRDLVSAFINSTYFDLVADLPQGTDLERLTESRRARAILVIPQGYGRDLAAGRKAQAQFLLDGTDATTASTVLAYARAIVAQRNQPLLQAWVARQGARPPEPIRYRPRVWYNPELKSTPFLVPGLIGFILMITGVLATALSVVREKERGTLDQLRVTPLHGVQLILGKTLPYLVISLMATGLFLLAAQFLFAVPVRGPLLDLFLATLIYLLGALGFGLLVSSMADSQAIAFQIGVVASMLPAIFLSGFVFPIHAAPLPIRWITYLVPARYYLKIIRGIILKGTDTTPYLDQLAFLGLYALVVLTVATFRLTRRET